MSNTSKKVGIDVVIANLKQLLVVNKEKGLYSNAIFYADKLVHLFAFKSEEQLEAIYELAQCYMLNKEYLRVFHLIDKNSLGSYNNNFKILLAQAFFLAGNIEECINTLEKNLVDYSKEPLPENSSEACNLSIIYLLLGKAYENQENKMLAIKYYQWALYCNSSNVEALEHLLSNYLLTQTEKRALIDKLSYKFAWIRDYYMFKIDPNYTPTQDLLENSSNISCTMELYRINESSDVLKLIAEKEYYNQNVRGCYEIIQRIEENDLYYIDIVPLYCTCLIELDKVGDLYYLAHKLVSSSPNLGMSWFAVGCYYYYIKKYDTARKFFQKCNSLDKHFAPGWIAYGHCFACQNESDQAMAAYRTAARLFPGCYYAHLCIGMEYLRTNNLKTALLSLNEANNINYNDPQVHNEIGVVHYKEKNYEAASTCFVTALSLCKDESSVIFEAVCKNLANCYRKQKEYDNAIELYERCIHINPKNASLYSSLGFTYHLKGKFKMALDCYHKANYLKPDDALTNDLIGKAMEDIFAGKLESGYFNMGN